MIVMIMMIMIKNNKNNNNDNDNHNNHNNNHKHKIKIKKYCQIIKNTLRTGKKYGITYRQYISKKLKENQNILFF